MQKSGFALREYACFEKGSVRCGCNLRLEHLVCGNGRGELYFQEVGGEGGGLRGAAAFKRHDGERSAYEPAAEGLRFFIGESAQGRHAGGYG